MKTWRSISAGEPVKVEMAKLELLHQGVGDGAIIDFDIDERGRLAFIRNDGDTNVLLVDGKVWSTLDSCLFEFVRHVRWHTLDRIALWSFPGGGWSPPGEGGHCVRSIGTTDCIILPIGSPRDIFPASDVIFISWGEERTLAAAPEEIESQILAVLSPDGAMISGFADQLVNFAYSGVPLEVSAACLTEHDDLVFFVYSLCGTWTISPTGRVTFSSYPEESQLRGISAITPMEGRLFFAKTKSTEVQFGYFDPKRREEHKFGSISHADFAQGNADKKISQGQIEIRGLKCGRMAISVHGSIWGVEFS